MNILIRAAALLAAGAAGWALARRKAKPAEDSGAPKVVYLEDDEAVIGAQEESAEQEAAAEVMHCFRRMDPLTLTGASDVSFRLADGRELRFTLSGEGGLHLAAGDQGTLTWSGRTLIRFEKSNGEVIGGMYYMPAGEESNDE